MKKIAQTRNEVAAVKHGQLTKFKRDFFYDFFIARLCAVQWAGKRDHVLCKRFIDIIKMVFMPHAQQVQLKISFYIDVAILYVFFCANICLTLRRKSPQRKKVTRFYIFAYYGHALLMEMNIDVIKIQPSIKCVFLSEFISI